MHRSVASLVQRMACSGDRWWLGLLILGVTLPFLGKALHIDDFEYVLIARHILQDPWRPFDFHWTDGGVPVYEFDLTRSPPLFNYALAAGLRLWGEGEIRLHCVSALFAALGAVAVYRLARRFTTSPLAATALVIANPLYLPGQNLMLDMPMLALGWAGIAWHIHGTDRQSLRHVLCGGLLVGLATVTKYPAAHFIAVMLAYSAQRRCWRVVPALALAAFPLVLWSAQNLWVHGRFHLLARWPTESPALATSALAWLRATLEMLGSGLLAILLVPRLHSSPRRHVGLLAGCFVVGVATAAARMPPDMRPPRHFVEHAVFLASGLFLVTNVVWRLLAGERGTSAEASAGVLGAADSARLSKNRSDPGTAKRRSKPQTRGSSGPPYQPAQPLGTAGDDRFLSLWFLLGLLVSVAAPFLAVRNLLGALAPGAFLAVRLAAPCRWRTVWLRGSASATAALGVLLAWSDMEAANLHRRALGIVRDRMRHQSVQAYYSGQHGFAYYCHKSGMSPLALDHAALPGGSYIISEATTALKLAPELVARIGRHVPVELEGNLPLNTMSYGVHFYRTGLDDLPWDIGQAARMYYDQYYIPRRRPDPAAGP